MFYKRAVLKFLNKFQAYNLHIYLKKDSCIGVFLEILRNI